MDEAKMEHEVISRERLGGNDIILVLKLTPNTPEEKKAIENSQNFSATDEETELIKDFLTLEITDVSILEILKQEGNLFQVKASTIT